MSEEARLLAESITLFSYAKNQALIQMEACCCNRCADDSESEEIRAEIRTVNNLFDSELRVQRRVQRRDLRAPRPAFRVRRSRKVNEADFN